MSGEAGLSGLQRRTELGHCRLLICTPGTSMQTVVESWSVGPFLCRAGQIWVVPQTSSWDVQWIHSAQINSALFSRFFAAAEPADNSGGRAGRPWRQWTRPGEADTLAAAISLPTSLSTPSLANLASFLFCLFLQRRPGPVNCQVRVKTVSMVGRKNREMNV